MQPKMPARGLVARNLEVGPSMEEVVATEVVVAEAELLVLEVQQAVVVVRQEAEPVLSAEIAPTMSLNATSRYFWVYVAWPSSASTVFY